MLKTKLPPLVLLEKKEELSQWIWDMPRFSGPSCIEPLFTVVWNSKSQEANVCIKDFCFSKSTVHKI